MDFHVNMIMKCKDGSPASTNCVERTGVDDDTCNVYTGGNGLPYEFYL
jgi:hypothetical protein